MRGSVQNLRDRLKSGLLGWLENIRLQYDHLVVRLKEQRQASAGPLAPLVITEGSRGVSSPLSPAQVQRLASVLKAESAEIDSLIKAVEKINLLSAANVVPPAQR